MDTKLKKFKYSLFTKVLCWLVAVCLLCVSATFALEFLVNGFTVGFENYLKNNEISFYESDGFLNKLQQDFFSCLDLADNRAEQLTAELQAKKREVVNDALNKYLDHKASIIESELRYAVNNWDDSYYMYNGSVDVTIPEEYNTNIYVNSSDPENIQLAQKILVNAKGQEFLVYEKLVRDAAFEERNFEYDSEDAMLDDFFFINGMNLTKEEALAQFSERYDEYVACKVSDDSAVSLNNLSNLESRKNLKYYVEDFDGNVYANIPSIPTNLKNNERYILANKGNHEVKGFLLSNISQSLDSNHYNVICMYFDESFAEDDIYGRLYKTFNDAIENNQWILVVGVIVSLVTSIAVLGFWLSLIGRKMDSEIKLLLVDKIPTDIHLVGVTAIVYAGLICIHDMFSWGTEYFDNFVFTKDFRTLFIIAAFMLIALLSEILSSYIRIKRSDKSILKSTLVFIVLRLIFKGVCAIAKKIKKVFEYKPKVFKLQFIVGCILFFLFNALVPVVVLCLGWHDGVIIVIGGLLLLIFDTVVCCFVLRFINNLDKIIVASGERSKVDFGSEKVEKSLKTLADNLDNYNDALDSAVAEAVKNEQMKAQLITNVSHDLKTPLTSLINYSDLLSKCEIEDETASGYIDVINNQSIKLKRLIEDLIEASKVSTGNVQLNKINLNLSELAVQAIVEYTPEFKGNKNEIKFSEPEESPIVFADSLKTYRIISNLLSNAKKYSARGTRIYSSVYEDGGFGCFEIKNISKDPLNISPEMLTERFVRGDESRTKEGNGLGLSIAKDLCVLQDGSLDISIDGDLFKVIVKLPKVKN